MAKANPFRFSTKYQDDESDLLYYGYRYYSASAGRWLSRDCILESGGPNLYAFVLNNSSLYIDILGREPNTPTIVIRPVSPDLGYDTPEGAINNSIDAERAKYGWLVIDVQNIADANQQLAKVKCACVKELNIIGHGRSGIQNIVGVRDEKRLTPGYGRLWAQFDKTAKKWDVSGLDLFKGVNFCDACTVILRGCSAAEGEAGRVLLQEVANTTRCTAMGWSKVNTSLTTWQGLPSSGYGTSPDVIIKPQVVTSPK
jgi:RHS repeat-associated protein